MADFSFTPGPSLALCDDDNAMDTDDKWDPNLFDQTTEPSFLFDDSPAANQHSGTSPNTLLPAAPPVASTPSGPPAAIPSAKVTPAPKIYRPPGLSLPKFTPFALKVAPFPRPRTETKPAPTEAPAAVPKDSSQVVIAPKSSSEIFPDDNVSKANENSLDDVMQVDEALVESVDTACKDWMQLSDDCELSIQDLSTRLVKQRVQVAEMLVRLLALNNEVLVLHNPQMQAAINQLQQETARVLNDVEE